MPREIIPINTSHYKGGNTYSLRLPSAVNFKKGDTLSLYSFSMYNSTYNISASQYANNTITFKWIDNTVNTWSIPDGYYSVSDLNTWLQNQFVNNGYYLVSSNGSKNTYFAEFLTNPSQYKNQINIYYVPTVTDASNNSLVKPAGATWNLLTSRKLPVLTINGNLKKFFGMSTQTVFGNETIQTKSYQYLSDTTPTISPVFSYFLTCNFVNSSMSQVPTIFSQFAVNASYGNLINVQSVMDLRVDIVPGPKHEIVVQLWDQDFNALQFKDPEMTLFLIVDRPEIEASK